METKDVAVGVIIGVVVAFILLRRESQSENVAAATFIQMQNRINTLEAELRNRQTYPSLADGSIGYYKNNEKWKITRGKEGYIEDIEVVRDSKVS